MIKYTIKKAFHKTYASEIWKIVVDENQKQLALETRDHSTTVATIQSYDFCGNALLEQQILPAKEWSLEALQEGLVILKKVGDKTPVQEGIRVMDSRGALLWEAAEYVFVEALPGVIMARHRQVSHGFETALDLRTGLIRKDTRAPQPPPATALQIPVLYQGRRPPFLEQLKPVAELWCSTAADRYLWTYHTLKNNRYTLNLCISDTSKVLYETCLLEDMPKMIPQPYFQLGNQIFLLLYNKREFVSYLL